MHPGMACAMGCDGAAGRPPRAPRPRTARAGVRLNTAPAGERSEARRATAPLAPSPFWHPGSTVRFITKVTIVCRVYRSTYSS